MVICTDEIKEMVANGELPEITDANYYDAEINKHYMSFHTWLSLHGCDGIVSCEAKAMAELNGEYVDDNDDTAFMIGSYVDAALVGAEGELDKFKQEHPEIFASTGKNKGELKTNYKMAEKMIARCRSDKKFMSYLSGLKQVIFVSMFCGVPFKCKLDSYYPHVCISDLKTTREMHKQFYKPDVGHVDFVSYYGYVFQLSIYQEVVRLVTGEKLPCVIPAVSKSNHPEIELIHVDDLALYDALTEVINSLTNTSIVDVWKGNVEPLRCESPNCHYCIDTKVLTGTINYRDLIGVV